MEPWQHKPAKDHGLSPAARWKSERRESGLAELIAQYAARVMVRIYLRVWHRVRFEGRENLPKQGPFILSANHSSHLDSVLLAQAVPWAIRRNLYPIAAGDVFFEVPVMAALSAWIINALPMWRKKVGRHALDELRTRLTEEKCCYILFPEGRREPDGRLLPFKAGLGMMIGGADIPVVPCFIVGAFEALPRERFPPRPVRITVRIGKPLTFAGIANNREGWDRIAAETERAVRELGGLGEAPPAAPKAEAATDRPDGPR